MCRRTDAPILSVAVIPAQSTQTKRPGSRHIRPAAAERWERQPVTYLLRRGVPDSLSPDAQTSFRFFIFTSRDPEFDFRRALVDALRKNNEVYYIWIRRRPVVFGPDHPSSAVEMPLAGMMHLLARRRDTHRINIYFDS